MESSGGLHVVLGTGAIGVTVARELVSHGRRVRVINHSGKRPDALPPEIELYAGSIADFNFAQAACQGAAVVYNCTNPPQYHRWDEQLLPLWEGALAAAAANGSKLVVMDNLYMYGPTNGAPIRESSPLKAQGIRGQMRIKAQALLLEAHAQGRARVTIGRASDYFGPLATAQAFLGRGAFEKAMAGKRVMALIDADEPHTFAFVPDIARGLIVLGDREEALGQVWHLSHPETRTVREFVRMIGEAAGTSPGVFVMPKLGMRALGLFVPPLRGLSELFYEWDAPYVVDDSKFLKTFGLRATPLPAAIAETVSWVRHTARAS